MATSQRRARRNGRPSKSLAIRPKTTRIDPLKASSLSFHAFGGLHRPFVGHGQGWLPHLPVLPAGAALSVFAVRSKDSVPHKGPDHEAPIGSSRVLFANIC